MHYILAVSPNFLQQGIAMNLFKILNANNYFTVNREIAREIGLSAAIFLSELIDKFTYFESTGQLDEGRFYLTVEDVEERTTLGKDAQNSAIQILKGLGFLEMDKRGMPYRRHFLIHKERIQEWCISNKSAETRHQSAETRQPVGGKPAICTIYKSPKEEPKEESVCSREREGEISFPEKIKKKHADGHEIEVSIQQIFIESMNKKKTWSTSQIEEAWKLLIEYDAPIRDPFRFIEGTISNIQNKEKSKKYSKNREDLCQSKTQHPNSMKEEELNNCKPSTLASDSPERPSLGSLLEKEGLI